MKGIVKGFLGKQGNADSPSLGRGLASWRKCTGLSEEEEGFSGQKKLPEQWLSD